MSSCVHIARKAQDQKEITVRKYNKAIREKFTITCDKCTHDYCCYQLVATSIFEGVLIADRLMRGDRFKSLRLLKTEGRRQRELIDDLEWEPASGQWFDWSRPCPLLDNGRCSVYDIRPVSCSSYCVVSAAKECAPPTGKEVGAVDNGIALLDTILQDGKFLAVLKGKPNDTFVTQKPLMLGEAVSFGIEILTHGAKAFNLRQLSDEERELHGKATPRRPETYRV